MNAFFYSLFAVLGMLALVAAALTLIVLAIVFKVVETVRRERGKDYHEGD
jgi:hypothetical protein